MKYGVAIISAGRPESVERMAPHLSDLEMVLWIVPADDVTAYKAMGASVVADPGSLVGARNMAMERTFTRGLACAQVSDDLKRIRTIVSEGQDPVISLKWALSAMDNALDHTDLKLAGCAPTDNLYFAKPGISTRKFVVGDLIMVRPTDLRFDENLRLKEDYDFTLQNWMAYGGAARCDYIAPSFTHYRNAGGVVSYRTETLEQETIGYLKNKWPDMLRDNPRRPNEILLTTPGKRER